MNTIKRLSFFLLFATALLSTGCTKYLEETNPSGRTDDNYYVTKAGFEDLVKGNYSFLRGRNNSLTAGDIGYRYLLRVLDDNNRSDVIYDMNNNSDVPGYGYQIKRGATALTESWQAYDNASNNHMMLGHIKEWFFSGLAGIRPACQKYGGMEGNRNTTTTGGRCNECKSKLPFTLRNNKQ